MKLILKHKATYIFTSQNPNTANDERHKNWRQTLNVNTAPSKHYSYDLQLHSNWLLSALFIYISWALKLVPQDATRALANKVNTTHWAQTRFYSSSSERCTMYVLMLSSIWQSSCLHWNIASSFVACFLLLVFLFFKRSDFTFAM